MAHDSPSGDDILKGLSPGERKVLTLLASGHTAKTIADSLDISTAAVNERLRSARRKTGAGSSRELARQLAQKTRDDFSGLATAPASPSDPGGKASSGRRVPWSILMFASAALAATAAITLTPHLAEPRQTAPVPAPSGPDADVVARLSGGPNVAQLRQQLASEGRDEHWAPAMEARVRERFEATPAVARSIASLSISCAARLCEVIGRTGHGATNADTYAVLEGVQSGDLNASLERLGLTTRMSSFTADPENPQGVAFVLYLERTG